MSRDLLVSIGKKLVVLGLSMSKDIFLGDKGFTKSFFVEEVIFFSDLLEFSLNKVIFVFGLVVVDDGNNLL